MRPSRRPPRNTASSRSGAVNAWTNVTRTRDVSYPVLHEHGDRVHAPSRRRLTQLEARLYADLEERVKSGKKGQDAAELVESTSASLWACTHNSGPAATRVGWPCTGWESSRSRRFSQRQRLRPGRHRRREGTAQLRRVRDSGGCQDPRRLDHGKRDGFSPPGQGQERSDRPGGHRHRVDEDCPDDAVRTRPSGTSRQQAQDPAQVGGSDLPQEQRKKLAVSWSSRS